MADDQSLPQADRVPASAEDQTLEKLLTETQTRLQEQRDAWMRAVAETENVRKRAQSDVTAAHKFAVERFAESLVPVCDSLEATLAASGEASEALKSGVELTLKQMRAALEKAGVSEIAPSVGERFDPNRHQAMAAVESPAEPNTLVSVMMKGYRLHERILRPALVTVAKALENKGGNPDLSGNLNSN